MAAPLDAKSACARFGGDPEAVGALLAAGLRSLSVRPPPCRHQGAIGRSILAVAPTCGRERDDERTTAALRQIRYLIQGHPQAGLDNRPFPERGSVWPCARQEPFSSRRSPSAYPVPIPVHHLATMFELCLSSQMPGAISSRPTASHPRRLPLFPCVPRTRIVLARVPSSRDAKRTRAVDA